MQASFLTLTPFSSEKGLLKPVVKMNVKSIILWTTEALK